MRAILMAKKKKKKKMGEMLLHTFYVVTLIFVHESLNNSFI